MSEKEQKIFKFISNYIKHPTLEMELTLNDGEIVTLKGKSFIQETEIVTTHRNQVRNIPISNVNKAEVFSF